MKLGKFTLATLAVSALVPFAANAQTGNTAFDDFAPSLNPSNTAPIPTGSAAEATPLTLYSPNLSQETLLANGPVGSSTRFGDNLDMIAQDPSGRYLFTPYETGSAGVVRYDLQTNTATELVAPGTQRFVAGDASRFTPYGTYLTAEENLNVTPGSSTGRLFEITNPTTATGTADTNFVQRSILPRVSHEGLAFDNNNNLYFIDEANSASIYRFTSANPTATNGDDFFAAGVTSVLVVEGGNNANATGSFTFVDITDANGNALAATQAAVLADGTINGRVAADLVGATDYQRPEDLEIRTLDDGTQQLFVATTTTDEVYSLNLTTNEVKLFASTATLNALTGTAIGGGSTGFNNPDNLAIDADGNIYIIEDQPGGNADIFLARDADFDGVAESLTVFASLGTSGAEPTGLVFDINNPNVAYLNVQHTASDVDRLLRITVNPAQVPVPGAAWLFGSALVGLVGRLRRRNA